MEDIIQELSNTRFLDEEYKNSNYFREYIDKICNDLKDKTYEIHRTRFKKSFSSG